MAREKGTGSLQQEKSGRWTLRVGINGKRLSRSTGTTDRAKAEAFLNRFLAPMGLGAARLPLAEAWLRYEMSPNRRDIAKATLDSKRMVWMAFARWMERFHVEIGHLAEVTDEAVAEYLAQFRCRHAATTYNNHVCVLREIFRVLAEKAGMTHDPWAKVSLRADDSVSRRELTVDEVERLCAAAAGEGREWKLLLMTGIYTGLRLGDCCRLRWENVNLGRMIIQVIPEKTKRHAHGRPVTIPIHPSLLSELLAFRSPQPSNFELPTSSFELPTSNIKHQTSNFELSPFVNPLIAAKYLENRWHVNDGLGKIFKAAGITMSVKMEGRNRKSVVASFHSLRHTFVSLSANAGVPLPVVQSIVGHCSTAMTRHYYHENEAMLRMAVESIPAIGEHQTRNPEPETRNRPSNFELQTSNFEHQTSNFKPGTRNRSIPARLRRLDRLLAQKLITPEEYAAQRMRILGEL